VYDAGKNTNSYTDRNFPRNPLVISAAQRASAEQTCKNAGVVAPFLEGCINDVVATGSVNSAQWAKALQEETVLRSFDIKFGEKEDKSLFYHSGYYETNNIVLGWGANILNVRKEVSPNRGFETTVYFLSEAKCRNEKHSGIRIRFRDKLLHRTSSVLDISFYDKNKFYDSFLGSYNSIATNIFDGKVHKIKLRYEFDQNTVRRTIWVDNSINFTSSEFNKDVYEELRKDLDKPVVPVFFVEDGVFENCTSNTTKLYRWSFKSL
jgi:hypothetical protein